MKFVITENQYKRLLLETYPYDDLKKSRTPELIAKVIKDSWNTLDDDEAWAEAAFASIWTKEEHDKVRDLLGMKFPKRVIDYLRKFMTESQFKQKFRTKPIWEHENYLLGLEPPKTIVPTRIDKPTSDYLGKGGEFEKQNDLKVKKFEPEKGCEGISDRVIRIYRKLEDSSTNLGLIGKASEYIGFGDGTSEDIFLNAIKELNSLIEISELEKYFKCHKGSFWNFTGVRGTLRGLIFHEFDVRDKSDKKYVDEMKKHLLPLGYDLYLPSEDEYLEFQLGTKDWIEYSIVAEHYHLIIDFLAVLSLFTGPGGKALSLAFEGLNIGLYLSEGDQYSAGLRICFALIPGWQLSQKIPGFKDFSKKYILSVFDKIRRISVANPNTVIKLTARERQAADLLRTYAPTIAKMANGKVLLQYLYLCLEKNTLAQMYRVLSVQYFKHYWQATAGRIILITGGIMWSWDKIAKFLGIEKMNYTNNEEGFKSFCKMMGLKFLRYDPNTKKGVAYGDQGGQKITYEFFYDTKINSFTSEKVLEILETTPTPTQEEKNIKDTIIPTIEQKIQKDSTIIINEYDRLMDSINSSDLTPYLENKAENQNITQVAEEE